MQQRGRDKTLRHLYLKLTAVWVAAWLLGVALLGALAISLHDRLANAAFADQQRLLATTVYGLTWFDADGKFHDELLHKESGVFVSGTDVWIIAPHAKAPLLLQPSHPFFIIASLPGLAEQRLRQGKDYAEEGRDRHQRPYYLYAKVTYDNDDNPVAVILVVADPTPRDASHTKFIHHLQLLMIVLVVLGLLCGNMLSRYLLRPVVRSFQSQERLLASAAHELRQPVANLVAVCESIRLGDLPADQGVPRIARIATESAALVDKLLLMARLDAQAEAVSKEPLRLDLLVEALLPEDGSAAFKADESVVVADSRLVQIAVRNLIENALRHGAAESPARIQVTVQKGAVIVEDTGPGFPKDLLGRATEPFQKASDSSGTGLGLAIVQSIAGLHSGKLLLENRTPHGSRVTLKLF